MNWTHAIHIFAVLLVGCAPIAVPPTPVAKPIQRGMWVWSNLPAVQSTTRTQLLDFAADHTVNTLYVQAQTLIYDDPAALRELIVAAAERDVAVELLLGKHTWSQTAEHPAILQLTKDVVAFVAVHGVPKPLALHLNIEPHTLPLWKQERQSLAVQLLDLLDKIKPIAHQSGLQLVFDMPNWYDSIAVTYTSRGGETTKTLAAAIIGLVDRVVLMDYNDNLQTQLDLAQTELKLAAAAGKTVVVASETTCGVPPDVTYCEEGAAHLSQTLQAMMDKLSASAGFGGVAVHHWQAWAALSP